MRRFPFQYNIYKENNRINTYYNMKRTIRLTEGDLHRIVKESVNRILKETSDKLLNQAIDASKDKVAKYEELYGKQSVPYHHACRQAENFEKKYDERYKTANAARRAKMERGRIDLRNKREGTTAGERERQKSTDSNSNKSKGLRRFFGRK
jgi:hypothetical protein